MQGKADALIGKLAELFAYDPTTGVVTRKIARGNRKAGALVGTPTTFGHLCVEIDGRSYGVHQIAWALYYGLWPERDIDHCDTDPANNKILNLREATVAQNIANSRSYARKSDLPRGVTKTRSGKFVARVGAAGVIYAGQFETVEAARVAANLARFRIYGEFAREG